MAKKRFGIFIGRMEPPHYGHEQVIKAAAEDCEQLIIVIGSANLPRTIKNPWTAQERAKMIDAVIGSFLPKKPHYLFLSDRPYTETVWLSDLQNLVAEATDDAPDKDIGLIVCKTDKSSDYLDEIPQWEPLTYSLKAPIHSTQIRERYFTHDVSYKEFLHPKVIEYMEEFSKGDDFKLLKEEYDFIVDYKGEWVGAPYPPTFVCADAVCIRSGHVLLIQRKASPGKGLWAIPGGFVGQEELIIDAAVRELKEETSIALTKSELKKSITESRVFDAVARSLRGRTISHAYLINLGGGKLDKIKPADDAIRAKWYPIDQVLGMEEKMFEDHFPIVQFFSSRA